DLVGEAPEAGERLEGLSGEWARRRALAAARVDRRQLDVLVGADRADRREERAEGLADDAPGRRDARVGGAEVEVRLARRDDEALDLGVVEDLPPALPGLVLREADAARRVDARRLGHRAADVRRGALEVGADRGAAGERGEGESGGEGRARP